MIKLYTWTTPNGYKTPIMLEELGLPYEIVPVNIAKGEQKKPEFLALNPNNKIPVLVDESTVIFESAAILTYLADKSDKFLPKDGPKRYETLEWVMFQIASVGPMLGQANYYRKFAPEKIPAAIERYDAEASRLYGVMETRLTGREYFADEYSIADIIAWPWVRIYKNIEIDIEKYPNVKAWIERVEKRPAVQTALAKTDKACGK